MPKNLILRIVVVALMLYALISLGGLRGDLRRTEQLAGQLEAEKELLAAENARLEASLNEAKDPEEMRRLAWERLGLVLPGEKIFYFTAPET